MLYAGTVLSLTLSLFVQHKGKSAQKKNDMILSQLWGLPSLIKTISCFTESLERVDNCYEEVALQTKEQNSLPVPAVILFKPLWRKFH